jgi:hypothetical protein
MAEKQCIAKYETMTANGTNDDSKEKTNDTTKTCKRYDNPSYGRWSLCCFDEFSKFEKNIFFLWVLFFKCHL